MKKLIYAISALAIVLAVGCSEDKVQTPEREYKLVVNMDKASLGDTTRAPRNSWLEGDEVMLFFGSDSAEGKWLIIKYQDGVWGIKDRADFDESGYIYELADEAKSLVAIYCSTPGELMYNQPFIRFSDYTDLGVLYMTCDDGTYSVDNNNQTFTINATLSPGNGVYSFIQFTVRDIDLKSWNEEDWVLRVDSNIMSCLNFSLFPQIGFITLNEAGYNEDHLLKGYKYDEDGVTFFGMIDNDYLGQAKDYKFGLTDGECYYSKTFTGKTLKANSAIIFNGPADCELGGKSNGWVRTR